MSNKKRGSAKKVALTTVADNTGLVMILRMTLILESTVYYSFQQNVAL
jgi:hypothetical protein